MKINLAVFFILFFTYILSASSLNTTNNLNITNLTNAQKQYLKEKKQIKMCVDPDIMPFEKMENGKHIGIAADFFKIFQKSINIPIKIVKTTSWSQSLDFVKKRKCDILSLAMKTPDRLKYINFTAPYFESSLVLVTKRNVTFIDNLGQLKGKKIGIVRGYATYEILHRKYPNLGIVQTDNVKKGLKRVERGELFGFIENIATIGYMVQRKFIGELKISGKIDQKLELGVAVRSDDKILLNIFNHIISELSLQTKQNILNKYLAIKYEKSFDYKLFWQMIAIFLAIIILMLFRSYTKTKHTKEIEKYLSMIDNNVLVSTSDKEGVITSVSQALCNLTGYTKAELIGKGHNIFRHKDMPKEAFVDMWSTIQSGKSWHGEVKNLNKDGSFYWADVTINPEYDEYDNLKGYSAVRQDITDKKHLEKLSITDALTKISNRLNLDNCFKKEFDRAKRYKGKFSLIIIDIDFFKKINDTYGHKVGDDILIQISQLLKESLRNTDILGRWGGEEFLIISPQIDISQAQNISNKIRILIQSYGFPDAGQITCSFGVTEFNQKDEFVDMFKRADIALYEAKNSGRNRVVAIKYDTNKKDRLK
ncbi:MAG: diguanylate cyclase [Epsilonproteobacteria bacterium]|nr:diguanylate cyclase [Campylobacterota bacterium]